MTAPAEAPAAVEPIGETDDGGLRVRFPVVVIENLDTSDGRFIKAGALSHRALPLSVLAQPASSHGGDQPGPAQVIGRIDTLTRTPGPQVTSKRTGEPFPEGTFVWSGEGVIDPTSPIADLVRNNYLRGVSVDLTGMDFEVVGENGFTPDPANPRRQVVTHAAEIAAITLVPIPAFGDCYCELAGEDTPPAPVTPEQLPEGMVAAVTPMWRSAEIGDEVLTAAVPTKTRQDAKDDGDTYPGTDKFPIATRDQAKNAVRLYGNSAIPAAKVKAWLTRRLKAKGWEDLIPDEWKSGSVTAALTFDADQRAALTAAATALLDKLGPVAAYRQAPLVFWTPESLAVADRVIEPPLDEELETLTAAGTTELPSISLFDPPASLPPGTGHYVDNELICGKYRRVYGRLAEWDVPHIGFDGRLIYPPRSKSGYRWFHTKGTWTQGPHGPERIKIGHLTFGIGHASTDPSVSHLAAAAHYDNSKYRGAKVRMYEDEIGPIYAGITVSGLDGERLEEFSESDTSGDWRTIMGNLELVAALCVNVGGFPKIGLSLAASGEPLALVASAKAWGHTATFDYEVMADVVAARLDEREQGRRDAAEFAALVSELDDTHQVVRSLLAQVDDTPIEVAALIAELDGDTFATAGDADPKARSVS